MNNTEKKSGQKTWKALTSILLLATLAFAGFIAIASEAGTSEDPLVSVSYLDTVLKPRFLEEANGIFEEKANVAVSEFEDRLNSALNEFDDKIAAYAAGNSDIFTSEEFVNRVADKVAEKVGNQAGTGSTFVRIELKAGQTLNMGIGCEVLLRTGSATCVSAGNPGLIDMSDSTELANGKALIKNHLYLCTFAEGRGIKATSNGFVFVRGSYTVS